MITRRRQSPPIKAGRLGWQLKTSESSHHFVKYEQFDIATRKTLQQRTNSSYAVVFYWTFMWNSKRCCVTATSVPVENSHILHSATSVFLTGQCPGLAISGPQDEWGDFHGWKSVASGGMSPSFMKLLRFHQSNKIHINRIYKDIDKSNLRIIIVSQCF